MANPGNQGDGLRHAFSQDPKVDTNDNNPTEAESADAFEGGKPKKAFTHSNADGNLYNTENDKPVKMEPKMEEPGSNRREIDMDRLKHAEVGAEVSYSGGVGTVVDRRGMYVTIYNKNADAFDKVHVGETYIPGDVISMKNLNVYWDDISLQSKQDLLTNVNIPLMKDFQGRRWSQIPRDIQVVIKEGAQNLYVGETPHGGMAGREPSHRGQNEESQSHRDVTQPEHVTRPNSDKTPSGLKKSEDKNKSDVEQGMYGGISTTQDPLDANDDYEDERPKKPLAGGQTEADKKPATVGSPRKRTEPNAPREAIEYNAKASQNLAGITGEPSKNKEPEEETQKAQQDMTAITGEPNKKENKDEVEKAELILKEGKLFYGGKEVILKDAPPEPTPQERVNKESTRYGPRYGVTLKEFKEQAKYPR